MTSGGSPTVVRDGGRDLDPQGALGVWLIAVRLIFIAGFVLSGRQDASAATFHFDCAADRYVSRPMGQAHQFQAPLRAIPPGDDMVEVVFEPQLPVGWYAQWRQESQGPWYFESQVITLSAGLLDRLIIEIVPDPTAAGTGWIDVAIRAAGDPYEVARCTYTLFSGRPVPEVDFEIECLDNVRYVDEPYTYFEFHSPLANHLAATDTLIVRMFGEVPEGWDMHFCHGGICYNPYAEFPVLPNAPDSLTIMCWVGEFAGQGAADLVLQSKRNPSLAHYCSYRAFLEAPASVDPANPLPSSARASFQATVSPNPTAGATTLHLRHPAAEAGVLSIFGVDGKLVFRYDGIELRSGAATIRWDGRDAASAALPSGLYPYRFEAGGEVLSGRIVLAR